MQGDDQHDGHAAGDVQIHSGFAADEVVVKQEIACDAYIDSLLLSLTNIPFANETILNHRLQLLLFCWLGLIILLISRSSLIALFVKKCEMN